MKTFVLAEIIENLEYEEVTLENILPFHKTEQLWHSNDVITVQVITKTYKFYPVDLEPDQVTVEKYIKDGDKVIYRQYVDGKLTEEKDVTDWVEDISTIALNIWHWYSGMPLSAYVGPEQD